MIMCDSCQTSIRRDTKPLRVAIQVTAKPEFSTSSFAAEVDLCRVCFDLLREKVISGVLFR